MATDAEMLAAVETAIQNILTGGAVQSYSVPGRSLSHYSLKELMELRDQLKARTTASLSRTNFATFGGPV